MNSTQSSATDYRLGFTSLAAAVAGRNEEPARERARTLSGAFDRRAIEGLCPVPARARILGKDGRK
jgi:hypothetical protein